MKKELCVKLVIYKDYTEIHGQKNTKCRKYDFTQTALTDGII
jgi:hypothetical protein